MVQAVILAAGESTRTYPLTFTKPKPLLKIAGKTILEHNLGELKGLVKEVILVIGYKKEMIKNYIGKDYKGLKIVCIGQKQRKGTAHALMSAETRIKGRFILMMGDNLYSKNDIKNCIKHRYSILTAKVKDPKNYGVVSEKNGIFSSIVEKPKKPASNLISAALYSFDREIFSHMKNIISSERKELELPDAVMSLSGKEKIYCVKSSAWVPISYPWDILAADRAIRKGKNLIGKHSKIKGKVKNSSIGNNCVINGDVKNSVIMDNSFIDKESVIEDSVIGENVYFKGTAKSAKKAISFVKNKKIIVENLGAIIGDRVYAKNVVISPGCKVWPAKKISGIINKDIT